MLQVVWDHELRNEEQKENFENQKELMFLSLYEEEKVD